MMRGAPNPNCYNKSPFVDGRIDHAQIREWLEYTDDVVDALQIDGWLSRLQGISPNSYEAIFIHYVEREPGGKHRLSRKQRIKRWHSRTGFGRQWYYERLRQGESFIGKMIAYEEHLQSVDKKRMFSGSVSKVSA